MAFSSGIYLVFVVVRASSVKSARKFGDANPEGVQPSLLDSDPWTDEAAMKNFMLGGVHRVAMRKLLEWCGEAALVHWLQETRVLPDWKEACRRLQNEGRRSKVNHPSQNQIAYAFPEPHVGRGAIRLK